MYPTSAAYKTAIAQNVRDVRISGTITLKDDTVINIADADTVLGSLYFTEQCVSGEDIEIGNVYAAEMGLSLVSPPANPYTLDGARIIVNFGIDVGTDQWEYVPLGYYYVTEIQRKATTVSLKALDGMVLFDTDTEGVITTGTPESIVLSCCSKAGVTLATNTAAFNAFANASTVFALLDDSKVETARDLLMWVCQAIGAFARMNRAGQLELIPVTSRASVRTISRNERFVTDVSDFTVQITKVSMKVGEEDHAQGTEGMTMVLEENPLLVGKSAEQINTALSNILTQVTTAEYVACNVDYAGDPSLQAGDFVTLTDTGVLGGGNVVSMITHSAWRYRGKQNIKAAGKSSLLRSAYSQQSKAVSSIRVIADLAREIAQAANQSTQLINDAIGGNVLIRKNEDGIVNEILIMDHADPAQATKIWRWNIGGLGYSDNVTGADNPARVYTVAMTMDGAINAEFVKTGLLSASVVQVGPATQFQSGYDPSAKETPDGAQQKANAAASAVNIIKSHTDPATFVLQFERNSVAYDSQGNEIPPNVPVFERF